MEDNLARKIEEMKQHCASHSEELRKRLAEGSQLFALHQKDIDSLNEWQGRQNGSLGRIDKSLEKISGKINELEMTIVSGRPTWAVSIIISALSAISVGLAVYVAKGG